MYRELITVLAGLGRFRGVEEELEPMLDYSEDPNPQDAAIYYFGRWIARYNKRSMIDDGEWVAAENLACIETVLDHTSSLRAKQEQDDNDDAPRNDHGKVQQQGIPIFTNKPSATQTQVDDTAEDDEGSSDDDDENTESDYHAGSEGSKSEDDSEETDIEDVEPELEAKTRARRQRIRLVSNTANLMAPSTTPTITATSSSQRTCSALKWSQRYPLYV